MIVKFEIPMRVFSINKVSTRDQRFKSTEYKEWALELKTRVQDLEECKQLHEMSMDFSAKGGYFRFKMTANYPPHIFYAKGGHISSKTIDLSNQEKPFIDIIFGDIMGINDKYITELRSYKKAAPFHYISVEIEYVPGSAQND